MFRHPFTRLLPVFLAAALECACSRSNGATPAPGVAGATAVHTEPTAVVGSAAAGSGARPEEVASQAPEMRPRVPAAAESALPEPGDHTANGAGAPAPSAQAAGGAGKSPAASGGAQAPSAAMPRSPEQPAAVSGAAPADEAKWMELVTADWTLEPGTEIHQCTRVTLKETLFLSGYKPVSPPGTHHSLLSLSEPGHKDGVEPCGPFENGAQALWASWRTAHPCLRLRHVRSG